MPALSTKRFISTACYVTNVPTKKPGPSGPAYPVRPKWQQQVRDELKAREWSQNDLAQMVGCTQPAIASVLKAGAKQSALVPRINRALGWKKPAEPGMEITDPERAELADLLDKLADEDVTALLATARRLTRDKQ